MPGRDFYKDDDLSECLRMMAEHHAAEETRHISTYEYNLLHKAADVLEDFASGKLSDPTGNGQDTAP